MRTEILLEFTMENIKIYYVKHNDVKVLETLNYLEAKRFYDHTVTIKDFKGTVSLYKNNELLFEEVSK